MTKKISKYLQAIWLWVRIWDICWWHHQNSEYEYSLDCRLAWEIATDIWLK